jgi:hypothetical protein
MCNLWGGGGVSVCWCRCRCVCACVRACVHHGACMHACVRACVLACVRACVSCCSFLLPANSITSSTICDCHVYCLFNRLTKWKKKHKFLLEEKKRHFKFQWNNCESFNVTNPTQSFWVIDLWLHIRPERGSTQRVMDLWLNIRPERGSTQCHTPGPTHAWCVTNCWCSLKAGALPMKVWI